MTLKPSLFACQREQNQVLHFGGFDADPTAAPLALALKGEEESITWQGVDVQLCSQSEVFPALEQGTGPGKVPSSIYESV